MNGTREMPSLVAVIISGASWASFYTTTVYPNLASESTTTNGSSCMTRVGWNLAEEGHSHDSMALGQEDPVISTLLYLFGLVEVRLRCSIPSLQVPNRWGASGTTPWKGLDSTAAVASFASPARSHV